jgi:hemolysin activation/secretion protein
VSGSVELRYDGWAQQQPVSLQPYLFYDIGAVWNSEVDQPARQSGASAGIGLRGTTSYGLTGNMGLAWPLTREISAPIYGRSQKGPRILLQISKGF